MQTQHSQQIRNIKGTQTLTHCTSSLYGSPSQSHTHLYIWEKPPEHRGNKRQRRFINKQQAKQLKLAEAAVQGLLPQGPGSAGLLFSHSVCRDDNLSAGSRLSFFITLLLRNKRLNQSECNSPRSAFTAFVPDGNFCISSQASCSQRKSSVYMREQQVQPFRISLRVKYSKMKLTCAATL